jgi:hypothetical protein
MAVVQANYPMAVDTDPVGGYPMAKGTAFVKGATGNTLVVNADGSINSVKTGANYTELQLLNLAILDTTLHTGATQSINTLAGSANIMIDNPLDQAVTVFIYVKNQLGKTFQVWTGSVASGGQKTLTNVDIPLLASPLYQIYATAQCTVAPLSGTLTATYGGVQA